MPNETGSLVNHLYSRMVTGEPEPQVGMGATILSYTDRHACTIIAWDGKICKVQRDKATRTDGKTMTDAQTYTYEANPTGAVSYFKKNKKGMWIEVYKSEHNRWCKLSDEGLIIGRRDEHYDFSF